MKKCKNLTAGLCSYSITLPYLVKHKWEADTEYRCKNVNVDKCLLPEILNLWKQGIKTGGNCCGHTRLPATIDVNEEYIKEMEDLGYKHFHSKTPEWDHEWEFYAKTQPTCTECQFKKFKYVKESSGK